MSLEPCFLTLDDKGRLRVHDVKEKIDQIIESEETFRSGKFWILKKSFINFQ